MNSAEKYVNDCWQSIASLHTARRGCGVRLLLYLLIIQFFINLVSVVKVAAFNGKLYTVGGHDGVRALCSVEIYDPKTDQWSPGPPLTSCRANVGVTVVGNRLYGMKKL